MVCVGGGVCVVCVWCGVCVVWCGVLCVCVWCGVVCVGGGVSVVCVCGVCGVVWVCVVGVCVVCVRCVSGVWVSEWRLVGQGTLHLHAPYITHNTSASFLLCFSLLFPDATLVSSSVSFIDFADMGSSTKHLRAKYGEIRERVCQSGRGGFLQVASWLYELADPELTAMYAESQDENPRWSLTQGRDELCASHN